MPTVGRLRAKCDPGGVAENADFVHGQGDLPDTVGHIRARKESYYLETDRCPLVEYWQICGWILADTIAGDRENDNPNS
jgi:hypothetical protein